LEKDKNKKGNKILTSVKVLKGNKDIPKEIVNESKFSEEEEHELKEFLKDFEVYGGVE